MNYLRCVKIMASEHTYKMLLAELKKRRRDEGEPGEPGSEGKAKPKRKAKAAPKNAA